MKKHANTKKSKKQAATKTELPDLVTAMMKLVERLEALEKKIDFVISRVSELASSMRGLHQNQSSKPEAVVQSRPQNQSYNNGLKERTLYRAVCADCQHDCEVPFKPTGERAVYCKECFAKRKAERKSQSGPRPGTILSGSSGAANHGNFSQPHQGHFGAIRFEQEKGNREVAEPPKGAPPRISKSSARHAPKKNSKASKKSKR